MTTDSPCSQRVVSENNITNSRIEVHTNSSKCGNIQTCTSHRCDETHTRICRNTCPPGKITLFNYLFCKPKNRLNEGF